MIRKFSIIIPMEDKDKTTVADLRKMIGDAPPNCPLVTVTSHTKILVKSKFTQCIVLRFKDQ